MGQKTFQSVTPLRYRKIERLINFLATKKGAVLKESEILEGVGFSHGSFIAARRALVENGLITIEKQGRSVVYNLSVDADDGHHDTRSTDRKATTARPTKAAKPTKSDTKKPRPKAKRSYSAIGFYDCAEDWETDVRERMPEAETIISDGMAMIRIPAKTKRQKDYIEKYTVRQCLSFLPFDLVGRR